VSTYVQSGMTGETHTHRHRHSNRHTRRHTHTHTHTEHLDEAGLCRRHSEAAKSRLFELFDTHQHSLRRVWEHEFGFESWLPTSRLDLSEREEIDRKRDRKSKSEKESESESESQRERERERE
jgi:hypothetical protein